MTFNLEGSESHLVSLRGSGDGVPLFCFPGAGGEIFGFVEMAKLLPDDQRIYAINMREFYHKRQGFTIEELSKFYLRIIKLIQERGPYCLCGYSFGGFVAYEIAAMLADQGEEIGLLALFDASNPALSSNFSFAESARFRTTYLVDRIKKYGRNLLSGNIRELTTDAVAFLSPRVGERPWLLIQSIFRIMHRPLPDLIKNNDPIVVAACRNYKPASYSKRLVLFRSEGRGPEFDLDRTLGWGLCATGPIDVHVVGGGHVSMMARPQVFSLVEKLKTYLDDFGGRGAKGPAVQGSR